MYILIYHEQYRERIYSSEMHPQIFLHCQYQLFDECLILIYYEFEITKLKISEKEILIDEHISSKSKQPSSF